jgi:hypothetical protein
MIRQIRIARLTPQHGDSSADVTLAQGLVTFALGHPFDSQVLQVPPARTGRLWIVSRQKVWGQLALRFHRCAKPFALQRSLRLELDDDAA